MVRPKRRINRPTPPPRVSPPTPVCETTPAGTTMLCACVARSSSPSSAPPWTLARRATGSTRTAFIGPRSITMPSSHVLCPGMLWPPPRTAIARRCARPCSIAATTSRTRVHRAISAGRRSCIAFHTARRRSYSASPGRTTDHSNPATPI
jgi:hypothetical protein